MVYLIDYENIKNLKDLVGLDKKDKVVVFYTKNANSLTFEDHIALQSMEATIEYKKVITGNNALDFQLSTYLGYLVGQNYTEFCIMSNDKGYDAIIDFWKNEKNISITKQELRAIDEDKKEKPNKPAVTKVKKATQNKTDLRKVLVEGVQNLKKTDVTSIINIINNYKTKQAINSNLQKHFKDNDKVGAIYKLIKPFLKDKK